MAYLDVLKDCWGKRSGARSQPDQSAYQTTVPKLDQKLVESDLLLDGHDGGRIRGLHGNVNGTGMTILAALLGTNRMSSAFKGMSGDLGLQHLFQLDRCFRVIPFGPLRMILTPFILASGWFLPPGQSP